MVALPAGAIWADRTKQPSVTLPRMIHSHGNQSTQNITPLPHTQPIAPAPSITSRNQPHPSARNPWKNISNSPTFQYDITRLPWRTRVHVIAAMNTVVRVYDNIHSELDPSYDDGEYTEPATHVSPLHPPEETDPHRSRRTHPAPATDLLGGSSTGERRPSKRTYSIH